MNELFVVLNAEDLEGMTYYRTNSACKMHELMEKIESDDELREEAGDVGYEEVLERLAEEESIKCEKINYVETYRY